MDSGAFHLMSGYPVAIVGAGPVGLTTALALSYYEIPFVVFEANPGLSTETKAGTTLIRTLEIWQRFGAAGRRSRRIGIVAAARKLLIALWRWVTTGTVMPGATLKPVRGAGA